MKGVLLSRKGLKLTSKAGSRQAGLRTWIGQFSFQARFLSLSLLHRAIA
jgi:hypothetical protein